MRIVEMAALFLLLAAVGLARTDVEEQTFGFEGPLKKGVPEPWVVKKVKGSPNFKVVSLPEREAEKCLYMHSENSSFSLNRKVGLELDPWRFVSWSWKGVKLPSGKAADARVGKKCDQGLQVMFAFDGGSRLISYVWDTNAPVDTRTTEGFRFLGLGKTVKVIVVQSGLEGIGEWSTIQRDLLADYRLVYGEKKTPKKVAMFRVQSNSQYTKTESSGFFGPVTFSTTLREQD